MYKLILILVASALLIAFSKSAVSAMPTIGGIQPAQPDGDSNKVVNPAHYDRAGLKRLNDDKKLMPPPPPRQGGSKKQRLARVAKSSVSGPMQSRTHLQSTQFSHIHVEDSANRKRVHKREEEEDDSLLQYSSADDSDSHSELSEEDEELDDIRQEIQQRLYAAVLALGSSSAATELEDPSSHHILQLESQREEKNVFAAATMTSSYGLAFICGEAKSLQISDQIISGCQQIISTKEWEGGATRLRHQSLEDLQEKAMRQRSGMMVCLRDYLRSALAHIETQGIAVQLLADHLPPHVTDICQKLRMDNICKICANTPVTQWGHHVYVYVGEEGAYTFCEKISVLFGRSGGGGRRDGDINRLDNADATTAGYIGGNEDGDKEVFAHRYASASRTNPAARMTPLKEDYESISAYKARILGGRAWKNELEKVLFSPLAALSQQYNSILSIHSTPDSTTTEGPIAFMRHSQDTASIMSQSEEDWWKGFQILSQCIMIECGQVEALNIASRIVEMCSSNNLIPSSDRFARMISFWEQPQCFRDSLSFSCTRVSNEKLKKSLEEDEADADGKVQLGKVCKVLGSSSVLNWLELSTTMEDHILSK